MGALCCGFSVNSACHLPCKFFLGFAEVRLFVMLFEKSGYLVKLSECEELVEFLKVAVVHVYPELVELVYARAL